MTQDWGIPREHPLRGEWEGDKGKNSARENMEVRITCVMSINMKSIERFASEGEC